MSEPPPAVTAMPSSSSSNSNPVLDYYQRFCDKTPFVTRTLTVFIVVEYILSFFIHFEDYLGNVTRFTILGFEIYRMLLSPFVGNSILTLIILLISYPSIGSQMEWSMGSSSYLYLMCAMSIATNLIFNAVCLLLMLVPNSGSLQYSCQGFWIILFSLITIDCMGSPDAPRRLLFIPIDIPSKYMPIAMYALFSLFDGPSLSFALAILVGYGSTLGYLDRVKPTSYYLEQLESNGGCLHSISRASGWVLASTVGHESWIPVNANTVIPTAEPLGHSDSSNSRSRASEVVVRQTTYPSFYFIVPHCLIH